MTTGSLFGWRGSPVLSANHFSNTLLAKQFPRPLKKALGLWVHVFIAQPGEFLQLGPLGRVQMGRHLDVHPHVQIAHLIALNIFHAFAFEPENGSRLCARCNSDVRLALQRWHLDLRAQRGLDEVDWHFANQVVAVALKNFVRPDVQDDIKISRRPAPNAALAVAGRAQARACVHARRNLNLDFRGVLASPGAVARAARFFNHASGPVATRTGLGDTENAAGTDDLPASAAGRARLRRRARFRAGAAARLARLQFGDRDLFFAAEHGVLERNLHVVTKVGAALRPGGITPFAAEQFVEDAAGAAAEDFAENLERIVESAAARPSARARSGIESGVAVLVISGALLRVAQRFIGFTQFFELFLGGLVARIFVGMIFAGQFPVGLLDFVLTGVALHAEDLEIGR